MPATSLTRAENRLAAPALVPRTSNFSSPRLLHSDKCFETFHLKRRPHTPIQYTLGGRACARPCQNWFANGIPTEVYSTKQKKSLYCCEKGKQICLIPHRLRPWRYLHSIEFNLRQVVDALLSEVNWNCSLEGYYFLSELTLRSGCNAIYSRCELTKFCAMQISSGQSSIFHVAWLETSAHKLCWFDLATLRCNWHPLSANRRLSDRSRGLD